MASNVFFDKDEGYDKLFTTIEGVPGETQVVVGFLHSSGVYKKNNITVAQVAMIHEFGSKDGTIPERSFMRSSIDANQHQLKDLLTKLTLNITKSKITPKQALGIVGQFVRDKMVAKIDSGVPPPNAQSTVHQKHSSKTLIDTGQLKGSIHWEIQENKKGAKGKK